LRALPLAQLFRSLPLARQTRSGFCIPGCCAAVEVDGRPFIVYALIGGAPEECVGAIQQLIVPVDKNPSISIESIQRLRTD
jgi:hypothetical protein